MGLGSILAAHLLDDFDERHEERDDDRADDEREEDDSYRFEQRGESLDRVVHFVVIDFGDLQEHLGELAGLFTHVHHRDHHGRKHSAGLQRLDDGLTFLDRVVNFGHGGGDDDIAGSIAGNIEAPGGWARQTLPRCPACG